MGKYLLLIAGVLVVYWMVRANLRRRRDRVEAARDATKTDKTLTDDMVRCADCGVHLPRAESLTVRGQFYCCTEHRQRHDPGR